MSETLASHDALSHALLDAAQEVELAKRIEAGVIAARLLSTVPPCAPALLSLEATVEELEWLVADGKVAREEFIAANYRLAISLSRKFRNRGFSDDDLVQDAYAGLIKAVDRFDHAKGFRFSTFAVFWIREALHSAVRNTGFIKHPEVLFNHMVKVRAVKLRLADELGRTPTVAEIAEQAQVKHHDVVRCLRVDQPVTSIHAPVRDDMVVGDLIWDSEADEVIAGVEARVDNERLRRLISASLASMPELDARILAARYGLDGEAPRSLQWVADKFGMNRHQVRSREQVAMAMLRRAESASAFATFLVSESA